MSLIPDVIIGNKPFGELYPQWEEVIRYFQRAIQEEIAAGRTPRAYLADENRFLNFFTEHVSRVPELGINLNQIQDVYLFAHDEFFGLGLLRQWLDDPEIEDILMDSYQRVDIVKKGRKEAWQSPFMDDQDALNWMQRIMSQQNKQLTVNNPAENGQLSDGSRIFCVVPPVVETAGFAIRKHRAERFQADTYRASGVAPSSFFDTLTSWVDDRHNILISGSTGSGKTTLINYTASLIDPDDRVLVVEDTRELLIPHPRVYQMTSIQKGARQAAQGDETSLTIRDLVRHTLRMKPDRIIVGEVRGAEAYDMLDAMNTGHDGCMTSLHSHSPAQAILRLESIASPAISNMPLWALQDLIGTTIGIVIQMKQMRHSSKRLVVEASQVFHPSQVLDKKDMQAPSIELRPERIFIRPLWLWNGQELEKVSEPVRLHGEYSMH